MSLSKPIIGIFEGVNMYKEEEVAVKQLPEEPGQKPDYSRWWFNDNLVDHLFGKILSAFESKVTFKIQSSYLFVRLLHGRISVEEAVSDINPQRGDLIILPVCSTHRSHWSLYIFRVEKQITLFHIDSMREKVWTKKNKKESDIIKGLVIACEDIISTSNSGQRQVRFIRPYINQQPDKIQCGTYTLINMGVFISRPDLLDGVKGRSLNLYPIYGPEFVRQIKNYMATLFDAMKRWDRVSDIKHMIREFQNMFILQLNKTATQTTSTEATQTITDWGGDSSYLSRWRKYWVSSRMISCSNTLSLEDTKGLLIDFECLVTEVSALSGKLRSLNETDQFALVELYEEDLGDIAQRILLRGSQIDHDKSCNYAGYCLASLPNHLAPVLTSIGFFLTNIVEQPSGILKCIFNASGLTPPCRIRDEEYTRLGTTWCPEWVARKKVVLNKDGFVDVKVISDALTPGRVLSFMENLDRVLKQCNKDSVCWRRVRKVKSAKRKLTDPVQQKHAGLFPGGSLRVNGMVQNKRIKFED